MNDLESVLRRVIREEVRSALEEMLPPSQSQPSTPTSEPEESLLLSTREAARRLAISERTLYELTKSGQLPCVRLGTAKRYSVETISKWIHETEGGPSTLPTIPLRKPVRSNTKSNQQKTVKRVASKRTQKKKPKSISNAGPQAISKATTQRKRLKEEELPPNPLTLLLDEMGMDWDVVSTMPNGDIMRIAGVDTPTYHGWRFLGRSMPEEAIQKLREHFRQIGKPE